MAGAVKNNNLLIIVLFGWLGIYRFKRKDYGLGFLYLITLGLLGIGWVIDILLCHYYNSDKFLNIKEKIAKNTADCNELNHHIEDLKLTYNGENRIDYGDASYQDTSSWNYRRPALANALNSSHSVYRCSRTVCSNASVQPFKYICKYFDIKPNEENLARFEEVLNNFESVEQGKLLLKNERDEVMKNIEDEVPFWVRALDKKWLVRNLGFEDIDFSQVYFPRFTFQYVSSGGNSSMQCDVVMNIENLNKFVVYMSELVKFKKSIAGQRALMTSKLREHIKQRDDYTCQKCHNSTEKEPNLLLEIDHIVPLAKQGLTTEDNLQTLCWRCNRHKGTKLE